MAIKSSTVHYFSGGNVSNDLSMKLGTICMTFQMNQPSGIFTSWKSLNAHCISLDHMALPGVKGLTEERDKNERD